MSGPSNGELGLLPWILIPNLFSFPELTWLALALRFCLTPASPESCSRYTNSLAWIGLNIKNARSHSAAIFLNFHHLLVAGTFTTVSCLSTSGAIAYSNCTRTCHTRDTAKSRVAGHWPFCWHHFSLCPGFTKPCYRDLAVCKPKTDVILSLQNLRMSQSC